MSEDTLKGPPATERFCADLTAEAASGRLMPAVERDYEIDQVVRVLLRPTKRNPVLVGEPGVGKTSVAEGLAQRIVEGRVPEALLGKRILALDLDALMTGTRWLGVFEENMSALIKEVSGRDILFVDELHRLVGAGTTVGNPRDACDMLKPALARGDLPLIGATTDAEYALIAQDGAFERRLTKVKVLEPKPREALLMVASRKARLEGATGATVRFAAIEAAVRFSDLMPGRRNPDKSVDLLEEACADVANRATSDEQLARLNREMRKTETLAAALRGDPTAGARRLLERLDSKLYDLRKRLAERVATLELTRNSAQRESELEGTRAALRDEEERAAADGDLARAAQVRFGELAAVERQLREIAATRRLRVPDAVVRARDVARVVSRRLRIPLAELWPIRRRGAA